MPLLSIIIPTYNRANLLSIAIESVLSQTYPSWELIIIDDGSTDNTKEVVLKYSDDRIRYIYQENQERSAARNNGIRNAFGDWICFLDSDDFYDSSFLMELVEYTHQEEADCLIIGSKKYYNDSEQFGAKEIIKYTDDIVGNCCLDYRPIATWEVVTRKKVFDEFLFSTNFNVWEDSHLYYRILSKHKYIITQNFGYNVVMHDGSGVFSAEQKVNMQMVDTYISAINDLFIRHERDLKINKNIDVIRINYIHSKYQMFFYRAFKTRDYKAALEIFYKAIRNKSFTTDFSYYIKSYIKLIFLFLINIKNR